MKRDGARSRASHSSGSQGPAKSFVPKSIGTKPQESAARNTRSSVRLRDWSSAPKGYVICVSRGGYEASLEVRKVYRLLAPLPNDPRSWIRVVDESGEDYLYPSRFFRSLTLPRLVQRAFAASQT
jgi:hypothetical protein